MVFVSAKEGPPNYGPKEPYTVQYFDEHGNMTIKSGGTKTWRNNNVGNLKYFKKVVLQVGMDLLELLSNGHIPRYRNWA